MKTYDICGLSRSGNHAIIFWIIDNLVESIQHIGNDIYIDKNQKVCFINNVNIHNKLNSYIFSSYNFDYLIRSYEDMFFNYQTNIIILRDFLNLICSRYKKYNNYKHNICLNNEYICDIHYLIKVWKQHTHSLEKTILYNKWCLSKTYRDKVCKNLIGIDNLVDNFDKISKIGGGSSFENKDYLNRYNLIDLPSHIKKIILEDNELLELNEKLFSIKIESILNVS